MTLIKSPSDEYYSIEFPVMNFEQEKRRIEIFLNVPNWKCECGLVNFGRNERCPRCYNPRPKGEGVEKLQS